MSPAIPFRRRSKRQSTPPVALVALAVAAIITFTVAAFTIWQRSSVEAISQIEVIDGDTVRFQGVAYRLSGFDAPEVGDKARCDYERRLADAATVRLRNLIAGGDARLVRVACACRPGQEGTRNSNFGRLCGSLSIGGRDAGNILISEGLAHPYICGATSCPQRRPWC